MQSLFVQVNKTATLVYTLFICIETIACVFQFCFWLFVLVIPTHLVFLSRLHARHIYLDMKL